MMSIIGYYVTCDDAECVWCHRPEDWPGFEDWEAPQPIFTTSEADSPTFCQHCGDLITHNLTDEGAFWVVERLNRGVMFDDAADQLREAYGHLLS